MKQIIIFLLIVIAALIGYGKYSQYQRFNTESVKYTTDAKVDINYYNQETVLNYYSAIEALNSLVTLQWTANDIDVRTPEDDDVETKVAVLAYADQLGKVKYYEALLANSAQLKAKGISNKEIQFLEENGMELADYQKKKLSEKIKDLFDTDVKLYNGEKNAIIYEVQKELVNKGYSIQIDGVYRIETLNAIKNFEEKNNLLADGYLDYLTIELLFE